MKRSNKNCRCRKCHVLLADEAGRDQGMAMEVWSMEGTKGEGSRPKQGGQVVTDGWIGEW